MHKFYNVFVGLWRYVLNLFTYGSSSKNRNQFCFLSYPLIRLLAVFFLSASIFILFNQLVSIWLTFCCIHTSYSLHPYSIALLSPSNSIPQCVLAQSYCEYCIQLWQSPWPPLAVTVLLEWACNLPCQWAAKCQRVGSTAGMSRKLFKCSSRLCGFL